MKTSLPPSNASILHHAIIKAGTLGFLAVLAVIPASAAPPDDTYHLVFSDEFDGTSVDTTKWIVLDNYWIGGGYSQMDFTPANATVSGGVLTLAATLDSPRGGRTYSSAFLFTKESFQYGYWEARVKMPADGAGMWPAFWMNNNGTYPEIDIIEWLGNTPNRIWQTYHPVDSVELTGGVGFGSTHSGSDFSDGFHTFGMEWKADSITWYVDGVQTLQITQGQVIGGKTVDITDTPMQTIINNAVGGWDNNAVDGSTVFPGNFQVDYVRIYNAVPEPSTAGALIGGMVALWFLRRW